MSARLVAALALLLVGLVAAACSGEKSESGLGEPLRVRNAVFKEGPLPGAPPDAPAGGVSVTSIETASTVLRPGQGEKTLNGRASVGTVAIAVGLVGLGRGHWLLPVDGPDPLYAGELGWQLLVEIARDVSPGTKELRVVAIDAAGHAGVQRGLAVCVPSIVPDNLNACDPANAPPASVVSLSWDTPVDLDLIAVAPDGRVIDAKHPRGGLTADAGGGAPPFVDRDSNGACSLDLVQREDLVFEAPPAAGSYLVYANLFDACGRGAVHFRVDTHTRVAGPDGKLTLALTDSRFGTLLALDANGGARLGTYVTEIAF